MTVQLQPVTLHGPSPDNEGLLLFIDDRLLAVLTRLSSLHEGRAGQLFVEAIFGDIPLPKDHLLPDVEAAKAWVNQAAPVR
jgi:hypothetical protein